MLRFFYIIALFLKYGGIYVVIKLRLYKNPKRKLIKNFFEEAGGAFIKFGQLLALRVDVLSKEYTLDLLDLLDNIRPFPYKEVEAIFLNELGATPDNIFIDFQKKPFASASFAQVHAAKLSENVIVAVKVMRPGIQEQVKVDLFIIMLVAYIADFFFKISALPWVEFAEELKKWTLLELNYHNEAENAEKLYQFFIDDEHIVIPKIYPQLTTKKILVEEYLEGIHLSRVLKRLKDGRLTNEKLLEMGINIKKVSPIITTSILKSYFLYGIFHADPHPGNIILLKNNKIGLIDFGIVGKSDLGHNGNLVKFIENAIELKYKEAAYYFAHFAGNDLKQMIGSALPASVDQKHISDFIRVLTDHFSIELEKQVTTSILEIRALKKDHALMLLDVLRSANKYKIKIPSETVIYFRTLAIVSILAKQMDPEFLLTAQIRSFFKKYPPETLIQQEQTSFKRINREVALEKLNSWISYLFEVDPTTYKLVKEYLSSYNNPIKA